MPGNGNVGFRIFRTNASISRAAAKHKFTSISTSAALLKINDGVYYATWLEFFNSLVLHNLIFPNTAYTFIGFVPIDQVLHAVLKQRFVASDAQAELPDIRAFLQFNGFEPEIRHDYRHKELGLLLEDMHDENVLVQSETLFFIDSVFYLIGTAEG
jgi:hypothetical protein